MSYDSRLFNKRRLREIVEISDDINEACLILNDCLACYEDADSMSSQATEEREMQRTEAWNQAQEIKSGAMKLAELMDHLEKDED